MNDDEVFLATEVTDPFERRGLCASESRWERASPAPAPRGATAGGNRRRRHIAYGFDDNGVVGLYHNRSTVVQLVLVRYSGDDWRNVKMLGEIRKIQFFNARLNDTKKQKLERRPMSLNFWDVLVWRRPTFATFRASVRARIHYDYFSLNHDI